MNKKIDHPSVYVPPPLLYVMIFFISVFIQKFIPLSIIFFGNDFAFFSGLFFIVAGLFFAFPALIKFYKTKNTVVTIKPANSLETTGIYSVSRNPMYLGLLAIYIGMAFLKGNVWTFICIPFVILVIHFYVIRNEEKYLQRTFGNDYEEYRKQVRRWL